MFKGIKMFRIGYSDDNKRISIFLLYGRGKKSLVLEPETSKILVWTKKIFIQCPTDK